MAIFNIGNSIVSNATNIQSDYSVAPMQTDGVSGAKETEYNNPKFTQWYGYYKTIPEFKRAVDMLAIWTLGKGYTTDTETEAILEFIKGWGNDTTDSILFNMFVIMTINGDSYAEIIRDGESGELLNIKPLDPSIVKVVANDKGLIKKYIVTSKIAGNKLEQEFSPREILHLSRDRVADEIHGVGVTESVEWVILARNECMADVKKLMHRHIKPMMLYEHDTDDVTQIQAQADKIDKTRNLGEDLHIAMGVTKATPISISPNATLNPLPWLEYLSDFFFQAVGIPQIILSGGKEFTESNAKIAYTAFIQTIETLQRYIERQLYEQLGVKIELELPFTLQNELISDQKKDQGSQAVAQPQDLTAGLQGGLQV